MDKCDALLAEEERAEALRVGEVPRHLAVAVASRARRAASQVAEVAKQVGLVEVTGVQGEI